MATLEQNPKVIAFYQLLEAAATEPSLAQGYQMPGLLAFFNRPEIKSRFLKAPASSAVRFHHAYDGGLLVHTLEVFRTAQIVANALNMHEGMMKQNGQTGWLVTPGAAGFVSYSDLLTVVALHDLNKIGDMMGTEFYVPNMIKNGTVRSDKIPYVTNDSAWDFNRIHVGDDGQKPGQLQETFIASSSSEWIPDGVKSLSLVRAADPKLFATLSPDVTFSIIHHDGAYGRGRRQLNGNETPLQMLMHFADMWSSRLQAEVYRG